MLDKAKLLDKAECARRLRAAREAAGLTQEKAAEALGVARPSYTQYELGKRVPTWTRLYEFIATLKLDPAILFPEFVPPAPAAPPAPKKRGR
jgi:transcriptional regulator with XRE-family HTH domain